MATAFAAVYIKGEYPDPEFERFAARYPEEVPPQLHQLFNIRARQLIVDNLKSTIRGGYSGDPITPLADSAVFPMSTFLSSQAPPVPRGHLRLLPGPGPAVAARSGVPRRAAHGARRSSPR